MNERIPFAACPLCGHGELLDHRTGDCSQHAMYKPELSPSIYWKRCGGCEHVFTDGYFTPQALDLIFSGTQENQAFGHDAENQRKVSARMIDRVLPHASQGRWLDVGFGNGSLLFTAYEYGFEPVGIDLRRQNVELMQSLGIEAYCQDLTEIELREPCAVVSMADVLEHMPFPKRGLQAAHRLMHPGGVLMVSMPNMDNIVWMALDQQHANPYWGEIEHYHNFSRGRLYDLLRETGFEPLGYGISERYRMCMEVVARRV